MAITEYDDANTRLEVQATSEILAFMVGAVRPSLDPIVASQIDAIYRDYVGAHRPAAVRERFQTLRGIAGAK